MLFSENNFTDLSHDIPDTSEVAADGIPDPIFGKKHTSSHYFSQNQNQTYYLLWYQYPPTFVFMSQKTSFQNYVFQSSA